MKRHKWFAVLAAMALVFTAFGCKTEIKTEYVDKTYCSAVTFTSEATEDGVKVTMETSTEGAAIYYTIDGTVPTEKSTKYSEPVEFTTDVTVKAIAVKTGMENSPVSVAAVNIKEKTFAIAVTFTSQPTTDGVKITMATATEDAKIYYTTDGTAPTSESTEYTQAVEFTEDTTLKAIAVKDGIENSPVSVATVSIKEKTITVEVEKKADETAPANVTNLAAQEKENRVLLTWTDAEDEDVYGYEITYSGKNPINRVVLPALDSKTMMAGKCAGGCYVSGLENGTEYTFTVKTVDTSGNKSEGVTVKATPVAVDAGETMKIALTAAVPQENGYTGNKSNTKVTVTAKITTASSVKKVVWKKDGSLIAKTLLADENAEAATVSTDNAVWTFDITPDDESANGTYTVAAIDEAGREEAEQITIDSFDFTAPGKIKVTGAVYSKELSSIIINWTNPSDADYDHVDITFTSNNGTANSVPSEAVSVNKEILNKTFSGIDGTKAYYTYTFVTYDELGNKGAEYTYKVPVKTVVSNVPEGFVEVTGGTVTGKSNTNNYDGVFIEGRTVTLSGFYMSQYEVTQDEYSAVMTGQKVTVSGTEYTLNANPSYCTEGNSSYDVNFGTEQGKRPVEGVTWYDAVYYCNALSEKEYLQPVYEITVTTVNSDGNITAATVTADHTKNGYRLPTEAEWEYAARGGDPSAAAWDYTFSGADTAYGTEFYSSSNAGLDAVGWYSYNNDTGITGSSYVTTSASGMGTHQVGQKAHNALGIYDMSGNVLEWCYDLYGTIGTGSETDPLGSSSGSIRVKRGGSWSSFADYASVCNRSGSNPDSRSGALGFRLVRSAQ